MKNIAVLDLCAVVDANKEAPAAPFPRLIFGSVVSDGFRFVSVMREYHDRIGGLAEVSEMAKQYLDSDNINFVYNIVDSEVDLIGNLFRKLYDLKPDLVVTWHIDWTARLMVDRLENHGYKLHDVACPPGQVPACRYANYIMGPTQKKLSDDRILPIHPADRKNRFTLSADFRFVDAMRIYRDVYREVKTNSYQLAVILDMQDIENPIPSPYPDLKGRDWHVKFQQEKPLLYMVDSVVDQLAILQLDKKTGFLSNLTPEELTKY